MKQTPSTLLRTPPSAGPFRTSARTETSAGVRGRTRKACACCGKNQRVSYTSYCLACLREKRQAYRRKNPKRLRARARKYYRENQQCIYKRNKAANLRWRKEHPKECLGYWLKSHSRATTLEQQKSISPTIVAFAGKSGRLVWPDTCDICGGTSRRLAKHHEDYSRPLWVTTLCPKCHGVLHASPLFWKRIAEEALPPHRVVESPDTIAINHEKKQRLESALKQLSFRQREILTAHFGLRGQQPLTLKELGRLFRITRERVRQVENRGLARLRRLLEAKGVTCV